MAGSFSGQSPWRRVRRTVRGATPAAGVNPSITVPGGKVWEIVAIGATLVSAVAAATRIGQLTVNDGADQWLAAAPGSTQIASLTRDYVWYAGAPNALVGSTISTAIPPLVCEGGSIIALSTTAIQAADAWTRLTVRVIETDTRDGSTDLGMMPELFVAVVDLPTP